LIVDLGEVFGLSLQVRYLGSTMEKRIAVFLIAFVFEGKF
jgi:hypothetical protein